MNEDIDKHLSNYQKIDFGGDIVNLEGDVKLRLKNNNRPFIKAATYAEKLFGVPAVLSGSALASTLVIGILLGINFQPLYTNDHPYTLDFDVFSSTNSNLPSSRLEFNDGNKQKY